MSNRLLQIGRVPLIPDPLVAIKASQAFESSQLQTQRVIDLGNAYLSLPSLIRNGIRLFKDSLDRAIRIRNLSTMSDTALADIGVRRDGLAQLYGDPALGQMTDFIGSLSPSSKP